MNASNNQQISQFEGSEQGTTIHNLEPDTYIVNEIKSNETNINQLGVNADAEQDWREDGFADGGRLDNITFPEI